MFGSIVKLCKYSCLMSGFVQRVKQWFVKLSSYIRVLTQFFAAPSLRQVAVIVPGKAADNARSPVTQMGKQDRVPGVWCHLDHVVLLSQFGE